MEQPLSVEKLLKETSDIYISKHHKSLPKSIPSSIEKIISLAEKSEEATKV